MGIRSLQSLLKTVDFAEKNVSFQKNANSKNRRVGRLRREKCQKIHILKVREFEFCCSAERIEAIAIQCISVMQSPREKNLQSIIVISNIFESLIIHETMLSEIFH